MKLSSLKRITKTRQKRLGQGHGSGRGKTAGRGTKGQKAKGNIAAVKEGKRLLAQHGEIPLIPITIKVEKQTLAPTIPQEYRPFTDEEERLLIKDGAHFIDLDGNTIEGQQTARRLFRYVTNGGDRLLRLPSIKARVAIYTDPKKFFIPNSGNKDLPTQEKLAEKDGQKLRKRLGLKDDGVDVIIPDQASTLTELTFKYLDETTKKGKGVWLFGPDYASAQGLSWVYGRTKNPVNESGSSVALVGLASPDGGVLVDSWDADGGYGGVLAVRLVVAKKK